MSARTAAWLLLAVAFVLIGLAILVDGVAGTVLVLAGAGSAITSMRIERRGGVR